MTLTLQLPLELEQRLAQEAKRHGLALDAYTVRLLEKSVRGQEQGSAVVALLQSWMEEGDSEEQRDTGAYLIGALDEDRLSERQLFPLELKGITW